MVELNPASPHRVRLFPLSSTKDGEIGVIGTGGCSLDVSRMEKSSHTEDILLSPAPYDHWTIMECLQQPEAIARALAFGGMRRGCLIFDQLQLYRHACTQPYITPSPPKKTQITPFLVRLLHTIDIDIFGEMIFQPNSGRMSEDQVVLGGFDRARSRLSLVRHLVLAACGTSLYASMYGAKLMRDLEALDTATVRWC